MTNDELRARFEEWFARSPWKDGVLLWQGWQACHATMQGEDVVRDAERLDWLGERQGTNLVSDDGGKWAVSDAGAQPVPEKDGFTKDVTIACFVGPEKWKPTIREAIDAAIGERHG